VLDPIPKGPDRRFFACSTCGDEMIDCTQINQLCVTPTSRTKWARSIQIGYMRGLPGRLAMFGDRRQAVSCAQWSIVYGFCGRKS
jgi:hypothetical protein